MPSEPHLDGCGIEHLPFASTPTQPEQQGNAACAACHRPIIDDDRHTRDEDGADVHGACCTDCP